MSGIQDKLNSLGDKINLKKRFPDYFQVGLFRAYYVFLVLVLIGAFVLLRGNLSGYYLHCPEDQGICVNPLYVCSEVGDVFCIDECPSYVEYEVCAKQYLAPGETYGEKNVVLPIAYALIFAGLLVTILLNHLIYKVKK